MTMIQKQREEVERLVGGLETVMKDLEGATEVLGGIAGDVKSELVEMGMEMARGGRAARL